MIISHKHKFIFIKTNKTAGTSIEISLSKFCGDNDIITPLGKQDEILRKRLSNKTSQNYLSSITSYRLKDINKLLTQRKRKKKFYNHISAKAIKKRIGDSVWHDYYKFCFERNPWDRVLSLYYFRYKKEPRPTLSEFINSPDIFRLKKKGYNLYTIDDKIVVDRICLYENLYDEMNRLMKKFNISENIQIPNAKSTYRNHKINYRCIYTDEMKERIAEIFKDEIELFGYQY